MDQTKNISRIGYFKLEIQKVFSPIHFEDRKKISCIYSVMNLVRLLTAESQSNIDIYKLIEKFYYIIFVIFFNELIVAFISVG